MTQHPGITVTNHSTSNSKFYGWQLYNSSVPGGIGRAPLPKITFCGRSISGYGTTSDWFGPVYIPNPDKQMMMGDCRALDGTWMQFGGGQIKNSHAKGINVGFADGHASWIPKGSIKYLMRLYGGNSVLW